MKNRKESMEKYLFPDRFPSLVFSKYKSILLYKQSAFHGI